MINFFHSADCYINCVIITCSCFLTALKYRLWILGPRIKKPCSQYRYYKTWFVDPLSTITVLLSLSTLRPSSFFESTIQDPQWNSLQTFTIQQIVILGLQYTANMLVIRITAVYRLPFIIVVSPHILKYIL